MVPLCHLRIKSGQVLKVLKFKSGHLGYRLLKNLQGGFEYGTGAHEVHG